VDPSLDFLSGAWPFTKGNPSMASRKRQTSTATPAKPGGLPLMLGGAIMLLSLRISALAALLLVSSVLPAIAVDSDGVYSAFGIGIESCGTYIDAQSHGNNVDYAHWLGGYVTAYDALNVGPRNILKGTDIKGAMLWLENYCNSHPTEDFVDAVLAFQASQLHTLTEALREELKALRENSGAAAKDQGLTPAPNEPLPAQPGAAPTPAIVPAAPSKADVERLIDRMAGAKPISQPVGPPVAAASGTAATSKAESVNVKYRGLVDLAPFTCDSITRSSLIERVCYDPKNTYMLIDLRGTWYHYCEIDKDTVANLLAAESMGHYYRASIKGRFDCRTHRVPDYAGK